jgi:5-hydroxyisourate hydrolase
MSKSITTHVLNNSIGKAAAGVGVTLEKKTGNQFITLASGLTNSDGRITDLLKNPLEKGCYQLTFDTGAYFKSLHTTSFYPKVQIVFEVHDETQHYHVPLLVSPFGYSTYRGT